MSVEGVQVEERIQKTVDEATGSTHTVTTQIKTHWYEDENAQYAMRIGLYCLLFYLALVMFCFASNMFSSCRKAQIQFRMSPEYTKLKIDKTRVEMIDLEWMVLTNAYTENYWRDFHRALLVLPQFFRNIVPGLVMYYYPIPA